MKLNFCKVLMASFVFISATPLCASPQVQRIRYIGSSIENSKGWIYEFTFSNQNKLWLKNDNSQYTFLMINGNIISGTASASGGSANAVYTRGTLIWDNAAKKFHCKVLQTKAQIENYITTKTNYWAQGGVSLALGKTTSAWKTMIVANGENIPGGLTGSTYRAGLVYNSSNNIWLVVSDGMCTIEAFRAAIIEKVGSGTLVDGISLDGSTCTQMVCSEKSVLGDRPIMSVLGFKR